MKGVLVQKSARGTGPCYDALGELSLGSMAELVVDVGIGSRHTSIVILVVDVVGGGWIHNVSRRGKELGVG